MSSDGENVLQTEAEMESWMNDFEQLRLRQWMKGHEEYGDSAFLKLSDNALFQMMYEEMADLANYGMMMYLRVRRLEALYAGGSDSSFQPTKSNTEHEVPPSPSTFVGAQEVSGFRPS